jgi:predicted TPR repeat methyltransferase
VTEEFEVGKHQVDVGCSVGLAASGIRMIIQKSEKIRISAKSTTVLTAPKLTHSRSNLLDKMKRLLSI